MACCIAANGYAWSVKKPFPKRFYRLCRQNALYCAYNGRYGAFFLEVIRVEPIGLYIHVPFCLSKCPYCDFYSLPLAGDDGLLAVLQNTTGETLTVVRRTDIPVALAAGEEQDELRDGRMFDDVQALEGYLESLSS